MARRHGARERRGRKEKEAFFFLKNGFKKRVAFRSSPLSRRRVLFLRRQPKRQGELSSSASRRRAEERQHGRVVASKEREREKMNREQCKKKQTSTLSPPPLSLSLLFFSQPHPDPRLPERARLSIRFMHSIINNVTYLYLNLSSPPPSAERGGSSFAASAHLSPRARAASTSNAKEKPPLSDGGSPRSLVATATGRER